MVLHNQYPWNRSRTVLREPARIGNDDFVVALHPRDRDVMAFIDRVKSAGATGRNAADKNAAVPARRAPLEAVPPATPYPPVRVREAFAIQPRLAGPAVVGGAHGCYNTGAIRHPRLPWSPMSAADISAKTGIEQRRYT